MNPIYQVAANAKAGRNGQVATEDAQLTLELSYPKEMGGSGAGNNPEQLFAAGYAACFSNAILHVAAQQKLKITEAPVRADIGIGPREDGGFALSAQLDVTLDLEQDQALELVRTAHQVCPYSHAIKGNIEVVVNVNNQSING